MDEQRYSWPELGITDLADLIWDGRLVVALVTGLTIAVGVVLYFVLPERYQSVVEITPLTGANFSNFAYLKEAKSFDYTRNGLLAEYAKYLTDRDLLQEVSHDTKADNLDVAFDVSLPVKDDVPPEDGVYVRMTARYGDKKVLDEFVNEVLKKASSRLAGGLRLEVERKVAAYDEKRAAEIKRLEVEIASKRQKLKAETSDSIEKLKSDASVARAVGLDKPLELQAQALTIDRIGPGLQPQQQPKMSQSPLEQLLAQQQLQQVPPGQQTIPLPQMPAAARTLPSGYPGYFDGYLALEERVKLLESRKNEDAFIPDLRDLEEQVYILKNDPQSDHIRRMLAQSTLGDPETAVVASYSLAGAEAKKSFPKASVFAAVTLAIGLILGAGLAIFRGVRKLKRDIQLSALARSSALPAS